MRERSRSQPGWPTPQPKPVNDGFLWIGALLLLALCLIVLLYFMATMGCAAPGARQGTAEVVTQADLQAAVETIVAGVAMTIEGETVTIGDLWQGRIIAIGVAVMLAIYPAGKLLWRGVGAGAQRFRRGRARSS